VILRGVGVFSSIIGIMAVRRNRPAKNATIPMRPDHNIGYMTLGGRIRESDSSP